ncbi:YveK family protein [Fredinandcohnia humi]
MRSTKQNNSNSEFIDTKSVKEIDLRSLYLVIKRRVWVLVTFVTITAILGYYFDSKNQPIYLYESSTRLFLHTEGGIDSMRVIIVDPIVLEKVIDELNIASSPEALATQINVESVGGQIVEISVTDRDPDMAASIANTTAETFKTEIAKIMDFTGVNIYLKAKANTIPINAGEGSNIKLMALVIGIVGGIGLIFLLNSLDNSIISEQDIQQTLGIPVLGSVSKINKRNTQKRRIKQQILKVRGETIDS